MAVSKLWNVGTLFYLGCGFGGLCPYITQALLLLVNLKVLVAVIDIFFTGDTVCFWKKGNVYMSSLWCLHM